MVANLYETLLSEVGAILQVKLFPDENESCQVKLKNGLRIQMEMDNRSNEFVIGIDLGPVPAGQYRETLFREALRANGMPPPRVGTLAFSQKSGHLVLFEAMHLQDLNGERIVFALAPLSEKALKWQEAIERGEVPVIHSSRSASPIGLFGIKP